MKTTQHGASVQSTQCTSSKIRFLALMIAALRAFTHNSFSSGLTARNTRFGTCKDTEGHKGLMDVDWNRVTNPKPVNLLTLRLFIPKIRVFKSGALPSLLRGLTQFYLRPLVNSRLWKKTRWESADVMSPGFFRTRSGKRCRGFKRWHLAAAVSKCLCRITALHSSSGRLIGFSSLNLRREGKTAQPSQSLSSLLWL